MKINVKLCAMICLLVIYSCKKQANNQMFSSKSISTKPNIIIILADDLGYADVGYHGGAEILTPNIDAMAANGVQFSAGYAMAPVCAPSRAGLLTGRYQNRFGFEDNTGGPFRRNDTVKPGIPLTETNIGEYLKKHDYSTAWIGKDHQFKDPDFHPINRGFDEFFGFINGARSYFDDHSRNATLLNGINPVKEEKEYLTDAFGREADIFIRKNKNNPFFLYLPFNAVHAPMQAKPEDLDRFKHIVNEKRRTLAAMHYCMDQNIGRITSTLKELNLEENTLIFFYSDNGGKILGNHSYNTPLKGEKGTLLEGGIRVPFLVQWKGVIPKGKRIDFPVAAIDILPTVLDVVNIDENPKKPLDGINLMPFLMDNKKIASDRYIYWRFVYTWAIRNNEWKLVKLKDAPTPELYHLSEDLSEANNVYVKYPEIVEELEKAFNSWSDSMMEPQWSWQPDYGGPYDIRLKE